MKLVVVSKESLLQLKFDPATIELLGIQMYSKLPHALAELVANAYDANAKNVKIKLFDLHPNDKQIIIEDDGDGMTREEVQEKFLVIGRKRREQDDTRDNKLGRKITGKKGIGKLALFGIGKNIEIQTKCGKNDDIVKFSLNWDEIISESGTYNVPDDSSKNKINKGTFICLSSLTRKSEFDLYSTAVSLSKLFNCFDKDFNVTISKNNNAPIAVNRELALSNIDIQFEWDLTNLDIKSDFRHKDDINGKIFSSTKPMKPEMRGIGLYANGRLVNSPSFFSISEAGHTFTYVSGYINVDYLDELRDEIISTDRQSLNWESDDAVQLQSFLEKVMKQIVKEWSEKRREIKKNTQSKKSGVKISEWKNTLSKPIQKALEPVIDKIESLDSIDDDGFASIIRDVHKLIPDYAQYHFRYLHKKIKETSKQSYVEKNYYNALRQSCIAYTNEVKKKANVKEANSERDVMGRAFGQEDKKILKVLLNVTRPNGESFDQKTINSIEDSQMLLSQGIITGFRNPLAHELENDLRESEIITEQHCLDALSLLSMLFYRLDKSQKNTGVSND